MRIRRDSTTLQDPSGIDSSADPSSPDEICSRDTP